MDLIYRTAKEIARFGRAIQYLTQRPVRCNTTDMAKRRPKKLSEQIRKLLDECGQTRYRIAQATGIDEGSLAKFYNGHRGLSMDALDRLAVYLGLRVTLEPPKGKKGK